MNNIIFTRQWAVLSSDTFSVKPIGDWVKKYLWASKVSVDPFARNVGWATYTNDLNPKTSAQYHLPAHEFLKKLKEMNVQPDLVIFDPPYNLSQLKECYEDVGREFGQWEAQHGARWQEERDLIRDIQPVGGVVLSFGYSSTCMTTDRKYRIEEILLVASASVHYDIICTAERKVMEQLSLFDPMEYDNYGRQTNRETGARPEDFPSGAALPT